MSSYFERYEVVWPDSDTDDCCGMGLRLDPDHIPKDVRAKDAARFMSLNTSQNFK